MTDNPNKNKADDKKISQQPHEQQLPEDQAGGITHKKDMNAGSGAFNQGSEQDPDYDKGTKVSDEEKLTGHLPSNSDADEKNERANIRKSDGGNE